jgi:hypothetical protein
MNNTAVVSQPTITEVQTRFALWRKTRKLRERIPEGLWSAAVMLCESSSVHKISRTLRLNHSSLRDRVLADKTRQPAVAEPSQGFITIDMVQPPIAECTIEMEHRNGNRMRMHFKGQADLALQAFAESFWI